MAEAVLTETGQGCWLLEGELSFASVPAVLRLSGRGLTSTREIRVDLQGVTRADSAGLALLVEWLREAERAGRVITFINVPEQLLAIARVCGLDEILSLQAQATDVHGCPHLAGR